MTSETRVQKLLEKEFGTPFSKKTLSIGWNIQSKPASQEFDAVAEDGRVIAMVKDYIAENLAGNQTLHARAMRDLYFLSQVQAQRRFLFLSKDYYQWFSEQRDAAIAPGIEVRVIPLEG
jgi:hypothetical protein